MKKFELLLFIFCFMSLLGCRDTTELAENTKLNFIIGTWDVSKVEYETFLGGIKVKSGIGIASGTISFFEDGTGTEDYTIIIEENTVVKNGTFRWENEGAIVTFDKGSEFETTWEWLVNEENVQVTKFEYVVGLTISDVTVTLTN